MKLDELFTDNLKNIVGCVAESERYKIILIDAINDSVGIWMLSDKSKGEISKRVCSLDNLKECIMISESNDNEDLYHERYQMIKDVLMDGFHPYLVGPAGCGKNHTCEQIAKSMNLDFYCINCVTQEFKILGYGNANGDYVPTDFYKAFTEGGLILIDEIDASCPEALVILNSALANGYLNFPIVGLKKKHKDFYCIAAGNTCGKGADELYNTRMVLDAASLNRFFSIEFGYDKRIEEKMALLDNELVDFAHAIRRSCEKIKYNLVFSYRDINMIARLKKYMSIEQTLLGTAFKGCGKDNLNNIYWNACPSDAENNTYYKALYNLIKK